MDNKENNHTNHGKKLNIRKRVQRVLLYSSISSADDDGVGSAEAPLPSIFEIESDYNSNATIPTTTASSTSTTSIGPPTMIMKHATGNNHTAATSSGSSSSNASGSTFTHGSSVSVRSTLPLASLRPLKTVYRSLTLWTEWIAVSSKRCWLILIVAIFIEIYATTLMKIAVDSKNLSKTLGSTFLYIVSLLLFGVSLRQIDVSVAYATWTAVGTATVAIFGILFFGESYTRGKALSLIFIITGVIGLNLSDTSHNKH
jgi:small multidrug resistance pump